MAAAKKMVRRAGAKPRRPASYHHGALRDAVLDRADVMLEKQGIENLSLRDVAADLGVSHAAPYRHFPHKMDLLFALAERGFRALGDAMEQAFQEKNPRERFEKSGVLYIRLAVAHPVRTQLMFSKTIHCEEAPESLRKAGERAFQGLVRIVEDGQSRGVFTQRTDSMTLALAAWSTVQGMASLVAAGQIPDQGDAFLRTILAQLFEGVRERGRK